MVGEGALLYPEAFPHPVGPARPSAGWLARVVAEERAELLDPEPLYLRRPDAVVNARTASARAPVHVIRLATAATSRPSPTSSARCSVPTRGTSGPWSPSSRARAAASWWPTTVGEPAGYAVSMTLGDIVDLQRIAVRPEQRADGLATALLEDLLAHTGAADRMLLEVSEGNEAARRVLRRPRLHPHRRATALLPRRVGRAGPAAGTLARPDASGTMAP